MKRFLFMLVLALGLASCASIELSTKEYANWKCGERENCDIVAIHHHAW